MLNTGAGHGTDAFPAISGPPDSDSKRRQWAALSVNTTIPGAVYDNFNKEPQLAECGDMAREIGSAALSRVSSAAARSALLKAVQRPVCLLGTVIGHPSDRSYHSFDYVSGRFRSGLISGIDSGSKTDMLRQ
jgi:hypothetical protein